MFERRGAPPPSLSRTPDPSVQLRPLATRRPPAHRHTALPSTAISSRHARAQVGAENVLVYARFNVTKIPVGVSVDIRVPLLAQPARD